ncbi:MAG: Gx transporter family protein [Lachnospiraceae bacterium]|nr:Gx transporter family protein [Lachnospiraceae bacterium]MBQ9593980.1 Gx transporter family protein [Lachnospiraceae bacterium]
MKSRTIAFCGVLTALALILSYVESLFPLPVGIPGIKLGLANLVVFLLLYIAGPWHAFAVSLARILIAGFAFGGMYSLLYSLSGGLLSFLGMVLLKRSGRFAPVTVSICGAVLHNIGQLVMAGLVLENTGVAVYLPPLLAAGVICGFVIGLLGELLRARVAKAFRSPNASSEDNH